MSHHISVSYGFDIQFTIEYDAFHVVHTGSEAQ
ncbi:hypothetical protein GGR05_004418 [Aureimonas phyllosphaerae]|uniref:Uncharacterized protein n=1 Tax=Aureimonas phyllosphaerae TaxID=1166078 RepID=A0A7W6C4F9_9HYPH|nr:hypothetical protein [Aureimonas phyllosphaerae]MBB3962254.1 hypothetical protein [Aureimonas phyllosphaerae]